MALLHLAIVLLSIIAVTAFSNDLVSKPEVQCGVDNIIVSLNTMHPFTGRLYVDGESEKDNCVRRTEGGSKNLKFDISIGECNMRRQRTLHPRGIAFSFTLVISFHPFFVTGQDKAFNIRCFFLESVKSLNTGLEVGALTTEVVEQDVPLPMCTYQLRGGVNGEKINFAQVGQKVTHVWHCDEEVSHVYGILIHSCFADDGRGNKFQLVDDNGCTTDPMLLPQIEYESNSITAVTHANVFKYADKVQLYFTCTVQLCYKHDGGCEGITPPSCSHRNPAGPVFHPETKPSMETDHSDLPDQQHNPPPPPNPQSHADSPDEQGVRKPEPVILPGPNEMSRHFIGSLPKDIQQKAVSSMQFFKNIQDQQREHGPPHPSQHPSSHGPESHELPYKDSPLNETEVDDRLENKIPALKDLHSKPFILPKNVSEVSKTDNGPPPKHRRHLKNMEADVTVEMLVLPPETEDKKEEFAKPKLVDTSEINVCVSKLLTAFIVAAVSTVLLIVVIIGTIIIQKQRNLLKKYNHLRAYN